ncbi:MAG TPA: hypothetical protein VNB64_12915 [Solirubrobacteraceae bacterium]|nr:hypothetical protein [Solirubrobacteraceae bacterium]
MPDSLEDVLAAVAAGEPPIEVSGGGELAQRLRERLGVSGGASEAHPRTVVETTGTVAEVQRALERVDDLGTVVLAGAPVAPDSTIDLYADAHVRGLTVIAAGPAGEARA